MWPEVFGPDWTWITVGAVAAAVVVTAVVVALVAALRLEVPPPQTPPREDPWHRFEIGDLTREEFERLRKTRRAA